MTSQRQRFLSLMFLLAAGGANAATEGRLVVHEWGTFTSVQGSNGQPLGGMHHEEEQLPNFVGGRDLLSETPSQRDCRPFKGFPICDDQAPGPVIHGGDVTQKMETPVIYFHSDRPRQMKVKVDFPQGIISQYYPRPTLFRPAIGQAFALFGGHTEFNVEVLTAPVALPPVSRQSVYGPAREVSANFIRSGQENEKFIFYRGLGQFGTNLQLTSKGGALTLNNRSGDAIPAVFLLEVTSRGGQIKGLGELQGNGQIQISASDLAGFREKLDRPERFMRNAKALLVSALVNSGLFKDEALAMVNTWERSYFQNPGLRVLYVLSRPETDRLLPLQVQPEPQAVERALVGRIEVLLDQEEQTLLASLERGELTLSQMGRFAEPKLRRLKQLAVSTSDQQKLDLLIQQANQP